jgi:adenosylcobinamide kinase/adenosylcobinamide-phosphate guanylyltransferase
MVSVASLQIHCRAVLVLGGARSGKSRYAQALAESASRERLFLATAQPGDKEMAERIARHRADRGAGWRTREEPLELRAALCAEVREDRAVVVDCVTLWLSNLMFAGRDLSHEISALAKEIAGANGPVVLVSNEVGLGIVPETELGREFRDFQGRANQELAAACDAVVFLAAGIPTLLKPATNPDLRLRQLGGKG